MAGLLGISLVFAAMGALAGCSCRVRGAHGPSGSGRDAVFAPSSTGNVAAPAPDAAARQERPPANDIARRDAAVVLAQDGGSALPRAVQSGRVVPTRLTRCVRDSDCVRVPGDCCGCTAGGTAAVVTRSLEPEFEAARSARCRDAVCVTMLSTHPSCTMIERCVEGSCRLVPPGAGASAGQDGGDPTKGGERGSDAAGAGETD